ncbi:hypothetical protein MRB53_038656 [Persea americana]|nr:hypothetical protein MRB53_038656 [Persea americana]
MTTPPPFSISTGSIPAAFSNTSRPSATARRAAASVCSQASDQGRQGRLLASTPPIARDLDLLPLALSILPHRDNINITGPLAGNNLRLDPRSDVVESARSIPVDDAEQQYRDKDHNRVIHVLRGYGQDCRQQEDDRNECRPGDGPEIDPEAEAAEVEGPRDELVAAHLADDGDAVRPVECDGGHVEDCRDGRVGAQPDQGDEDAEDDCQPDGVDGRVGAAIDLVPDAGEREELVAGECLSQMSVSST